MQIWYLHPLITVACPRFYRLRLWLPQAYLYSALRPLSDALQMKCGRHTDTASWDFEIAAVDSRAP